MKNLIKIMLICSVLFLAAAPLIAKTPPATTSGELSYLKELVDDHINFPKNFCPGKQGIVKAQITIDKNRQIQVQEINGCPGFKEYVADKLQDIIVDFPQLIGKSYICKIDFRL